MAESVSNQGFASKKVLQWNLQVRIPPSSSFITSLVIVKETSPAEDVDSWSFDSQSQWKCHLRHGSQPPSPQAEGIPLLKLWAGHGLWQPEGNPNNWGLNVPRLFDHPADLVWYGYVLHECCQAEMEIHQCFFCFCIGTSTHGIYKYLQ